MLKETFRFRRYDCSGVFVRMMMLRVRTMKRLQRFSVNFLIMCSAATSPVLCVCVCVCVRSDSRISRLAQRWNQRPAGDALIKDLKPLLYPGSPRSSVSLDR